MMKTTMKMFAASVICFGIAACDVDKTKDGELPDVDVNASGGEMPEYDVDTADVDVGTENKVVEVPTVDVDAADAGNNE